MLFLLHGSPLEITATPSSMVKAVIGIEKWQELGHQLNIDPEKLSNLFKSSRSGAECRDEMIAYWERHDKDASWEKLSRALSRMGENRLAKEILKERGVASTSAPPHPATITNQESSTYTNIYSTTQLKKIQYITIVHAKCSKVKGHLLQSSVCVALDSEIDISFYFHLRLYKFLSLSLQT